MEADSGVIETEQWHEMHHVQNLFFLAKNQIGKIMFSQKSSFTPRILD